MDNQLPEIKPPKIKRTPLSELVRQGIRSLFLSLTAILLVLGFFFLSNFSLTAQKGYAVEQENIKKQKLLQENKELNSKIVKLKSFNNIENSEYIEGMSEPEEVKYIE